MNLLTETDLYLLNEGRHLRLYDKLGAHLVTDAGRSACHFAVWAPNAARVSVLGDWNGWTPERDLLSNLGQSGVWQGCVEGVQEGQRYVYQITSRYRDYQIDKADPFAFSAQQPPDRASVVTRLDYTWGIRSGGRRGSSGKLCRRRSRSMSCTWDHGGGLRMGNS